MVEGRIFFACIAKLSVREVLVALKEAGVDSLPGGGAEIFNPRVRRIICDHKTSGKQWLEIARIAHEIGLRSNATMLYGHIENEERARRASFSCCANCRTIRTVFKLLFRWHFIRKIQRSRIFLKLPASTIFARLLFRVCCWIISITLKPIG